MNYGRFAAMIATSTVVMFGLMYLNTYVTEHIFYSETRVYMALLMGGVMAVVMMGFMGGMYPRRGVKAAVVALGLVVAAGSLWLVRSQTTVGDVSYMRAMIPHHSIAIMTSGRANLSDPRVRKLADAIIAAQQKEISEMRYLIADLEGVPLAERPETLPEEPAEVVPVSQAISSAVLATLDLADMSPAEVLGTLGKPSDCTFRRTVESGPTLAATDDGAVLKISGQLVELRQEGAATDRGVAFAADGIKLQVTPAPDTELSEEGEDRVPADLLFALDSGLTVGYRGYWACDA